ncbi:MAG: hypothetical protein Q4B29_03145 [Candidatus Saccharibacteria bacterium]|nr:hypothetical protein [Candidatus Saccharibacteria bacterium]
MTDQRVKRESCVPRGVEISFLRASQLIREDEHEKLGRLFGDGFVTLIETDAGSVNLTNYFWEHVPNVYDEGWEIIGCYVDEKMAGLAIVDDEGGITLYEKPFYSCLGVMEKLLKKAEALKSEDDD